jgi:UDP-glucose 4-epimerase|tara:strand:+ start:291 stop:1154 length:864 start_codon:yes stop_codon:yes gene_type:complete
MKVLVTGGAGFVGTNLIKRLLKDGYEVVSIDNYSTGKKENEQDGCLYYDYDLSYNYVRDGEYDVIFHMAALARIQPSLEDPHKTLFNNFVSTLNILDYVRRKNEKERWANKIKVVYAGSSTVHDGLYKSPYGWSKFSGEDLCKLYSNVYDMETSICRFYNVYGPHQIEDGRYATLLGIFQKQYREGSPLTITGDGEQRRDFTHIDDIVNGVVKSSKQSFRGEIFELGRGANHSVNEIADMFGKEYPKEYIEQRPGECHITLADYSHAHDLLNWKPTRNIEDYIKKIK